MRPWLALAAVAGACTAILVAGDATSRALLYNRDALLDGQIWRALTCHLVHRSWSHLGFNGALGVLAVALFGRDLRWQAALLCALGVSAGLFLGSIHVAWYGGLSGLLYGLLAYGALCASRRHRFWLIAVVVIAAKLIVDELRVAPRGIEGNLLAVDAHLYGGISGVLAFAILYRPGRVRS